MMDYSAGIVLVKMINDVPHMLCLRIYHSYDLPKGKIEDDEDAFAAAKRETFEEAGIDEITFPWGNENIELNNGKKKRLTLFVGQTTQEPHLRPNPISGKFEHHAIRWLSLNDAENMLHDYLKPAVGWIKKVIKNDADLTTSR